MEKQQTSLSPSLTFQKRHVLDVDDGMIALELNSVARIATQWMGKISFSDGEMPAAHQNPEVCFFHSLITNHV